MSSTWGQQLNSGQTAAPEARFSVFRFLSLTFGYSSHKLAPHMIVQFFCGWGWGTGNTPSLVSFLLDFFKVLSISFICLGVQFFSKYIIFIVICGDANFQATSHVQNPNSMSNYQIFSDSSNQVMWNVHVCARACFASLYFQDLFYFMGMSILLAYISSSGFKFLIKIFDPLGVDF